MFNDEDPIPFKNMHEFSTVDCFVEIAEELAAMIKFVANEPSMGLFYVQKHTHNSVPNLINLKNNVVDKSHNVALQAEDLEDSISMIRSMKECGFPIADEMIGDIKKSLSIISTKQPKRGMLRVSSLSALGRTSSWSPYSWTRKSVHSQPDGEKSGGYLSSVFKSAKERAGNLTRVESNEVSEAEDQSVSFSLNLNPPLPNPGGTTSSSTVSKTEDPSLLIRTDNELRDESQLSKSMSDQQLVSVYESYNEFKADKEANFKEWLGGIGNEMERPRTVRL